MVGIPEAARSLGIAASTLRLQVRLGKVKAAKLGRDWYLTTEEVERYRVHHLRVISSDGTPERIVPVATEPDAAA